VTPKDLVCSHRYEEGAAECAVRLEDCPNDQYLLGWQARAMLCLGRLPEALEEYRRLDRLEKADLEGSDGSSLTIGAILWLLGRNSEAIQTFQGAADGIEDYSIKFGDLAGGVSPGLLLWYTAVTARDADAREHAIGRLRNRARDRGAMKYWPGSLALFVLGAASRDDVLAQACGTSDPKRAVRDAAKDLLKRRRLARALFYFGTHARDRGSEPECHTLMRASAGLQNPIVELEWYLARGEVKKAG
jgi:tetratricopeptide (TPR) repeat protein